MPSEEQKTQADSNQFAKTEIGDDGSDDRRRDPNQRSAATRASNQIQTREFQFGGVMRRRRREEERDLALRV
ncbi:hypothetical protein U1Q18_007689 [Sarracenia purpurea var. burkii]